MKNRSSEEWVHFIGLQIKNLRIQHNLKQDELVALSKVSKSALFNLESGKGSTLKTLVAVLEALGETKWLETLAPDAEISPMEMVELGKRRQRVRK